MKRSVIRDFLAALNSPGFHFVTSGLQSNGSSRLAIRARRDSIGRPWPIDPTSKAVFGELKGAPLRLAEVFGFGRANRTGMSDLVLWSPDGESRRPVGKDECRGYPKGKPAGGVYGSRT